jgi:hypothetical protein
MTKSRVAQHEQRRGFWCFRPKLGLSSPYMLRLPKTQGWSKTSQGERFGKSQQTSIEKERAADAGRPDHLLEALPKEGDRSGVREWSCEITDCCS